MFIRALLPFEGWRVEFFEIDDPITNGQILIVEEERYALAINEVHFDVGKVKKVRIPENIEILKFWIRMEFYILNTDFKINQRVQKEYRSTKGNQDISIELMERKLKRNLLLCYRGSRVPITDQLGIVLQYGFLRFIIHKNKIVHLSKTNSTIRNWKKCPVRYEFFTKQLEVEGL